MSREKRMINNTGAPNAVGTYSQGVEINGLYIFSGQIGIDPETAQLRESFSDQLECILSNIDRLLGSQGLERSDIIKTTIFMTDLGKFSKVNEAYEAFFQTPYPARSTMEVSALPKNAQIEIEVIAYKK